MKIPPDFYNECYEFYDYKVSTETGLGACPIQEYGTIISDNR